MSSELIKVGFSYVLTKYFVIGINFVRTVVVASALGPASLGEYAFIVIILEYMNYSNLGIFHAMNKEVSISIGKDEKKNYIKKVINNTFSFQALNSLFLGFLFLLFYLLEVYGRFENTAFDSKYLMYIFILGIVFQMKSFIFVHLRLFDKFTDIVKIELLSSIFVFIGVYFFIDKFKIDAILLVSIIGNLIIIIPTLFRIKSLNFSIEYKLLRSLILLGLPLLLFNFLVLLTTSIDRVMISQLVSSNKATLGIFHFGYLLSFGVMTAFNSVIFLLVPKVLRQFNSHSQDTDLMMEQSKLVENVIILIAILGITILPTFIHIFMPQYVQSILVMQFLLLAYSVNGLSFLPGTYMIANNLQLKLLPAFLLSLSTAVLLNYLSIELGYGIYGVAIATIFTFGIYTFGLFLIYLRLMKINLFRGLLKIFWKLGVFIPVSIILLYERSNLLWILLLYTLLYGKDFIKLSKLYYPLLKSSIR